MRFKKPRKPRTKSQDMCVHCGNTACDPWFSNTGAALKIQSRVRNGLCPGCGNSPRKCICKSSSALPMKITAKFVDQSKYMLDLMRRKYGLETKANT